MPVAQDAFTSNGNKAGYKAMYAEKPIQHVGLKAGIERHFYLRKYPNTNVYFFYDFQFTHAIVGHADEAIAEGPRNVAALYGNDLKMVNYRHGPATTYEHYVGIGIESILYKRLFYRAYAGLGRIIFHAVETDTTPGHYNAYGWGGILATDDKGMGVMFGFGLNYKLK